MSETDRAFAGGRRVRITLGGFPKRKSRVAVFLLLLAADEAELDVSRSFAFAFAWDVGNADDLDRSQAETELDDLSADLRGADLPGHSELGLSIDVRTMMVVTLVVGNDLGIHLCCSLVFVVIVMMLSFR